MELLAETYVVLDVPDPFGARVLELRRQSGDDFRAALPAEITLIGSGGAGPIMRHQQLHELTRSVRAVAKSTSPIETSFGRPMRFPDSDVFVFPLSPAEPVFALHAKLCGTGVAFRPSPWPFVPHCTISSRSPIQEVDSVALLTQRIDGNFVCASISIYTTDRLPTLALVERVQLNESSLPYQ